MHKDVRDVIKWAAQYGWTLDQDLTSESHPVLRHTNGERYTVPGTPSDWRSLQNCRADLRRLAGVDNDSGPAAKYRHQRNPKGFSMEATRQAREAREQNQIRESIELMELCARYTELIRTLRNLNPRREQVKAHKLASEAASLKRRIEYLGGEVE